MWSMPEVDDFIDHVTEISIFIENNLLALKKTNDPSKASELISPETFYRTDT
jgi:hypothetical protein